MEWAEKVDRILNKTDEPPLITKEDFISSYIDAFDASQNLMKDYDKIGVTRDIIRLLSQYISMFTIDEVDSKRIFLQLTGVEKVDMNKIGDMFNPNWQDKNWKDKEN